MERNPVSPRLVIGLFLVLVAALFLLDNAGMLEVGPLMRWWPGALIVLGLTQLVWSQGFTPRLPGLVLTLMGAVLLYSNLRPEALDLRQAWGYVWPMLVLLVGVSLITRGRGGTTDGSARVSGFVMMSGQAQKNTSTAFRGGDLTAIMGGYELDLRDARMDQDEALLEIFALMGGFEIRIPEDWMLQSEVMSIMGGVENSCRSSSEATHTLRLKGFVMMGGVEVRN